MESRLHIEFLAEEGVRRLLSEIKEVAESDSRPSSGFLDHSDDVIFVSVGADSLGVEVMELHGYACDSAILTASVACRDIVRDGGKRQLDMYLDLVKELYEHTATTYVFGDHTWRIEGVGEYIRSPVTDDGLEHHQIGWPMWLMVFSPPMVESYGREWLLDLPAARTEELSDGGIMMVATYDFLECSTDEEVARTIGEATAPIEDAFGFEAPKDA